MKPAVCNLYRYALLNVVDSRQLECNPIKPQVGSLTF
jgi:hypothetical protein